MDLAIILNSIGFHLTWLDGFILMFNLNTLLLTIIVGGAMFGLVLLADHYLATLAGVNNEYFIDPLREWN